MSAKNKFNLDLEEMAKAGVQFGHKPSKLHPKMKEFIFRLRGRVYLIDLDKTKERLEEAIEFIQNTTKGGGKVLFVGTKIQHKGLVQELAEEHDQPFVTERWLGGLLTNFGVMKARIDHFKQLRKKVNSSDFEKYSRKEQVDMEKELSKLKLKFGGLEGMVGLPDAVFVCDLTKDDLALKEAGMKDVPVIAIADTNVDPTDVDYLIPANDDSISSVKYILSKISEYGFNREG